MTNLNHKDMVIREIEILQNDPLMISRWAKENKTLIDAILGVANTEHNKKAVSMHFPNMGEFSCVQTAIFDNWPDGVKVKGKGQRYGFNMRVFNRNIKSVSMFANQNVVWQGNAKLYTNDEYIKYISKTFKNDPVRKMEMLDTAQTIIDLAGTPDALFGIPQRKVHGMGTVVFWDTLVAIPVSDNGDHEEVYVLSPNTNINLGRSWVTKDATGKDLTGNAIKAIRWTNDITHKSWATEVVV